MEVGRICIKKYGREKGKKCVIVDVIDKKFVMIDGNVKRRRCNIEHLEMLPEKVELEKAALTEQVKQVFEINNLLEPSKIPSVANKRERKGKAKQEKSKPVKKNKTEKPKKAKAKTDDEIVETALAATEA